MADTTISSLTPGTPAGSSVLPYSTGSNTLGVPVSAIFQGSDKIGIGINNPQFTLDLTNTADTGERAMRIYNGSLRDLLIGVEGSSGNRFSGSSINNAFVGSSSSAGLELATNNNVRMYINSDGNVGIGTTTPSSKLEVNGTIKATGLNAPGCVVQIAMSTYSGKESFTDATQYNNFYSTTFTPKFATSKVFIQAIFYVGGNGGIRIRRNTTSIFEPLSNGNAAPYQFWSLNGSSPDGNTMRGGYPINWLDTPSTTSTITYNFDVRCYPSPAVGIGFNQNSYGTVGAPSTVTFMEIAG
jgi:hypothetical protein